jgi:6-phosphofructokinase
VTHVADILEAAIIKPRAHGRAHGVAVLAEGLLERLEPETLGPVDRDAYGNVRLAEMELSRLLKQRVTASLRARGLEVGIVAKELGYELRCAPPGGFDIQYCRSLGYWATRFLLEGGTDAIVTVQGGRSVPIPFRDLIDATTGREAGGTHEENFSEGHCGCGHGGRSQNDPPWQETIGSHLRASGEVCGSPIPRRGSDV